jgi:hypothetical protein
VDVVQPGSSGAGWALYHLSKLFEQVKKNPAQRSSAANGC